MISCHIKTNIYPSNKTKIQKKISTLICCMHSHSVISLLFFSYSSYILLHYCLFYIEFSNRISQTLQENIIYTALSKAFMFQGKKNYGKTRQSCMLCLAVCLHCTHMKFMTFHSRRWEFIFICLDFYYDKIFSFFIPFSYFTLSEWSRYIINILNKLQL